MYFVKPDTVEPNLLLNRIAHKCAYRHYHTGRLGLCLATLFRVFTD